MSEILAHKAYPMREISTHKAYPAQNAVSLHYYDCSETDGIQDPVYRMLWPLDAKDIEGKCAVVRVKFAQSGKPGITNEALLAIIIDRLETFQKGPLACDYNQDAINHLRSAMTALHDRTLDRRNRDVDGTQAS